MLYNNEQTLNYIAYILCSPTSEFYCRVVAFGMCIRHTETGMDFELSNKIVTYIVFRLINEHKCNKMKSMLMRERKLFKVQPWVNNTIFNKHCIVLGSYIHIRPHSCSNVSCSHFVGCLYIYE